MSVVMEINFDLIELRLKWDRPWRKDKTLD